MMHYSSIAYRNDEVLFVLSELQLLNGCYARQSANCEKLQAYLSENITKANDDLKARCSTLGLGQLTKPAAAAALTTAAQSIVSRQEGLQPSTTRSDITRSVTTRNTNQQSTVTRSSAETNMITSNPLANIQSVTSSTVGKSVTSSTVGKSATSSTVGKSVTSSTVGKSVTSSTVGKSVTSSTVGKSVTSSTVGKSVTSSTVGKSVTSSTFGNSYFNVCMCVCQHLKAERNRISL